jgi:capsid portal protein
MAEKTAATIRKVTLEVAGAGQTAQEIAQDIDPWTPNGGVTPPVNFEHLAALTLYSGVRRSCIAAIAQNTVGLGYEFRLKEGHEDETTGDLKDRAREIRDRLDSAAARDQRMPFADFAAQLYAAKWDEQEVGNGYIEVSRNVLSGEVDGLYHVPGKRIRRRVVREQVADPNTGKVTWRTRVDGWIMGPRKGSASGEIVRFYDFGDKVQYDADGRPTATLKDAGRRWENNELIAFQLYTSASPDYGLPPDAHLAVDYLGDKLAANANVGYFDGSAVPPTVIFVQGKEVKQGEEAVSIEVDASFVRAITNTLKSQGNVTDRVAIVPVPPGTKTDAHQLAVLSERDLGFVNFRSDNRRRTLGAYRLSPIFVADIEDAGKYTADVERAITKEQVFDPDQERTQGILARTLMAELAPDLEIEFGEIAIKGDEAERESANDGADRGVVTRREFRAAHGKGPLPEAADNAKPKPGEVEAGWNDQLMPAGLPLRQTETSRFVGAPGETPPIPGGPLDTPFAKSGLGDEIVADFDAAVDDAIRTIHELDPDAEVQPVVIEKVGDRIEIRPYSAAATNGDGP